MKISQENRQHQKIPLSRGVKRSKRDGLPGMPKVESGVNLENAVLENNAEIAQARKTGKISKESKALAQFGS